MLGNKHAFSGCYVCEVMHAMSTSTVHPLNTINNNTAHVGVKLFEFSIAHISCCVTCIELKLGTDDEEGITKQIRTLCISVLGIF